MQLVGHKSNMRNPYSTSRMLHDKLSAPLCEPTLKCDWYLMHNPHTGRGL